MEFFRCGEVIFFPSIKTKMGEEVGKIKKLIEKRDKAEKLEKSVKKDMK